MASTNFIDFNTAVPAAWLNDVNTTVYSTVPALPTAAQLAAPSGSSQLGYSQSGSTTPRTVQQKLEALTITPEEFGAVGTGLVDDSSAFISACSYLSSQGGGSLLCTKQYLLATAFTIQSNVSLIGVQENPGEILPYTSANYLGRASVLIIPGTISISLGHSSTVSKLIVLRQGLTMPFADATVAATQLALFSGTAFTVAGADTKFENLLILGFNQAIYSLNHERITCNNVKGDCNNGIYIENCADIARLNDCHFWPFTTGHASWTATAPHTVLQRSGIAYDFINLGDWNKATNCFCYGYFRGFAVRSANNVTLLGCGADNTSTAGVGDYVGSFGFLLDGGSTMTKLVACQTAAQSVGFYLNAIAGGTTQMSSCEAHGCSTSGVYVNLGNVQITSSIFRVCNNGIVVNVATSHVDIDYTEFDALTGVCVSSTVATTLVRLGQHCQFGSIADGAVVTTANITSPIIATAASLLLPLENDLFLLTGTTNFGTITGGWNGRKVTLITGAAVIALHSIGANAIRLAGNVNFSMVANSSLQLVHNGSQWIEIGRAA